MLTVLVVDDNPHLQIAFKKILTAAGYKVKLASDGEEGLRRAIEKPPDVIVLDMLLPRLGGVEVLRELKQNPATENIPVIALSGLPQRNETKLKREGAVSYLEKSRLDGSADLLQAIDYALILPRENEFRESFFLPNASQDSKSSK
jgi:CheY-like chemotaxis protein